jgi:hypothetical protein
MANWTKDELVKIGNAEELLISSLRNDGTLRKQRIIWIVRLGDDLYVRSVNGRGSDWFRGVQTCHEGHIQAGGIDKEVSFLELDDKDLNDRIDEIYRQKYHRYAKSIIDHITSVDARSAALKLVPR